MEPKPKPRVTLYTRAGCCLCDDAKRVIASARDAADFDYEEVDIDGSAELARRYNDEVPIICIDGAKAFEYRAELGELLRRLRAQR